MDIKTPSKSRLSLTVLSLIFALTLIAAGCSGGGGGGGNVTGGDVDGGGSAAKATLGGTLVSSGSSSGNSLFKRLSKTAGTTSDLPVSGATVLCFDTESVSTSAVGTDTTDSNGEWSMEVDQGDYACFGIYIDLASLTIKTARMDDIAASEGETVTIGEATVEADTTSPTIVSVLSDNLADTSLSDGDPDPLYEVSDVMPNQTIAVIFSEAMNTSSMASGNGVVLKDSSGSTVSTSYKFNGTGTEFRYTPSIPVSSDETYTLYITNRAKDLSGNSINDPDSDGVVALARITVAETVDPLSVLSSNPKNGASDVSVYKDLSVTFNRQVDFVSFKENTTIAPSISGRLESSGDGVTFFHKDPLAANTLYTVTIGANVADLAGNNLGTPVTVNFITGAALDTSAIGSFDPGGGTAEDLLAIIAGITKAKLALDNQDLVTFASFFAPTFTMTERDCFFDLNMGMENCRTSTIRLSDFLEQMKKDLVEQKNMAKGFGQVERLMLTSPSGARMSVEHFNSDFDSSRNPIGVDLYVGWPNRIPGIDFLDAEIDISDPWSSSGTRTEFVKYRLDPNLANVDRTSSNACRDVSEGDQPGLGEVLVTYHRWDPMVQRDREVTQICQVVDGDGYPDNSWASDNEFYPSTYSGPKNVWEDNNQDGMYNEDGLISLRDTDGDGIADSAYRLYVTDEMVTDPNTDMSWPARTPHEDPITLSEYNVAAAMAYAASQNWDIEGVDNDGDSRVFYWDPDNPDNGGDIDRRVNEDWPDGQDNDGDCDIDKDGTDDLDPSDPSSMGVCVDEDNDGMKNDPWPQDGDVDTTNDPMPWNDWNLANKDSVMSVDELWAQTFLVVDPALAPENALTWQDDNANTYYEIPGPKGWPYTYAVGGDGKPWSGDELHQLSDSSDRRVDHTFAWGNISTTGKFYFNNEDATNKGISSDGWGVFADLDEATQALDGTYRFGTSDDPRYIKGIYKWNNGELSNSNGENIDWQYVHPKMDRIDYNADGDWNPTTTAASGLRRVPHDNVTGGVMSDASYLDLGWETWKVRYDYQLISDSDVAWDVEADWERMEGDDDRDGLFNEDGRYTDYFDSDGSLKSCPSPKKSCMENISGVLTLYRRDGTTTTSFDISDGVDNDFDGQVDEVEPWDDDGDGSSDEDPVGDPKDLNGNGNIIEPYDDDGDGRKDEDPVSYERDRINDHTQWARIYQQTTDAVVETFYLEVETALEVVDIAIDSTGLKATGVVNLTNTETWIPNNPWGEDFNRDGVPDNVNTWTETMVFNLKKFSTKWLMTSIHGVEDFDDYQTQLVSGDIKQFGGNVARIAMISPMGDPMTGPATNTTTSPTFQWDDSDVSGNIGSYLIHIEEITEDMFNGGKPSTVMMILIDPNEVSTDTATGVRSFTLGTGGLDVTESIIDAFSDDPYFPFETALTALENGNAYSWGILAFSKTPSDIGASLSSGKPEPVGDSFEPMLFATTTLPGYFSTSSLGGSTMPKAKIGGKLYKTIPSDIAPSFYDKPSNLKNNHHLIRSMNTRLRS